MNAFFFPNVLFEKSIIRNIIYTIQILSFSVCIQLLVYCAHE